MERDVFGRTGPTGQRGPPPEVAPHIPVGSNGNGPFHLTSARNFRKFWLTMESTLYLWQMKKRINDLFFSVKTMKAGKRGNGMYQERGWGGCGQGGRGRGWRQMNRESTNTGTNK